MATIPSGEQIVFISPNVNMTERKSAVNNDVQTVYTMQDIIDTTSGGIAQVWEAGAGTGSIQSVVGGSTASGNYALAHGVNSNASGYGGIAIGQLATASGYSSFALGTSTTASGIYSMVRGYETSASGYHATASGHYSTAIASYATALGKYCTASGSYSTASGQYATASGNNSLALGAYATASGYGATAFTYSNASGDNSFAANGGTASGYYAVAISSGLSPCEASGEQSFAIGVSCQAAAPYSGVLGGGVAAHTNAICINANSNRDNAVFVNDLSITNIPTSAGGLPSGAVWSNSGVLNIVP